MPKRIEIAPGEKFNRLTYLQEKPKRKDQRRADFRCECGKVIETDVNSVRCGHTKSCGCYHLERIRTPKTHGATVGRRPLPEYVAWKAMKARCYDKNNISYKNYGARGVKVCERWLHDFEAFLVDVGWKPSPKHSLERKDVNGDYEPNNVKWASRKDQSRNTRQNKYLTLNGKTRLICEWAEISGIPEEHISARIRHGWEVYEAIFRPIIKERIKNAGEKSLGA